MATKNEGNQELQDATEQLGQEPLSFRQMTSHSSTELPMATTTHVEIDADGNVIDPMEGVRSFPEVVSMALKQSRMKATAAAASSTEDASPLSSVRGLDPPPPPPLTTDIEDAPASMRLPPKEDRLKGWAKLRSDSAHARMGHDSGIGPSANKHLFARFLRRADGAARRTEGEVGVNTGGGGGFMADDFSMSPHNSGSSIADAFQSPGGRPALARMKAARPPRAPGDHSPVRAASPVPPMLGMRYPSPNNSTFDGSKGSAWRAPIMPAGDVSPILPVNPDGSDPSRAAEARKRRGGRYNIGDHVLISNHQSRWANQVNRHGFPPGRGDTPEEKVGPYIYVLATVQDIHFTEYTPFYRVLRADTGAEGRADAQFMEPIETAAGLQAAFEAATQSATEIPLRGGVFGVRDKPGGRCSQFLQQYIWKPLARNLHRFGLFITEQAEYFLGGLAPYRVSLQFTGVNLIVLCSIWYNVIDQARLAFFPPEHDGTLAIISFVVWIVLVLELLGETFIRPDNYKLLLTGEKAFAPQTVRHINAFHLAVEAVSLIGFVPEFMCVVTGDSCGERFPYVSLLGASLRAVLGPTRVEAFRGRVFLAFVRLRIVGLVRLWKQMIVNKTAKDPRSDRGSFEGVLLPVRMDRSAMVSFKGMKPQLRRTKTKLKDEESSPEEDEHLTSATKIGLALLVINSHRALMLFGFVLGVFPVLSTLSENGGSNPMATSMIDQLHRANMIVTEPNETSCEFLRESVVSWLHGVSGSSHQDDRDVYVVRLQVLPVRCDFQRNESGIVTQDFCDDLKSAYDKDSELQAFQDERKEVWCAADSTASDADLAHLIGVRPGVILSIERTQQLIVTDSNGVDAVQEFRVGAVFNEDRTVRPACFASFLLQAALLVFVLTYLSVLRVDAGRLVLYPLRRMLRIVALYAKNPLAPASVKGVKARGGQNSGEQKKLDGDDGNGDYPENENSPESQLGTFETEKLINAIAKITDLLRKCWGVAGAGIISSNLAKPEDSTVFNPLVPGKCVYALFAFAAIKGFEHQLKALSGDIMILINDVAAVLHGEVFRWGFADRGQCNKNLGGAFLMVFRIGDVTEVRKNLDRATDVIFDIGGKRRSKSSSGGLRRRRGSTSRSLSRKGSRVKDFGSDAVRLASLPGIAAFTDRALIGMLKTYAGIYRDKRLLAWKNDFRLGAGVGAFSVDMIFGMDAGWAVEGAVGSEYKIDATYLSPHVNMASRMMSACKQYGVNILLSQAVEELMSKEARSKLRHLDTVTVKGSSVKQRIFTYDARHKGVDFFLFERTEEQADRDSEDCSPTIWNSDQDLQAMRQHVTEEFVEEFNRGRDAYLEGKWVEAIAHLRCADDIMVQEIVEQGFLDVELNEIKSRIGEDGEDAKAAATAMGAEMGDGPSRCLIAYMEKEGGEAPPKWQGYRPLTSK